MNVTRLLAASAACVVLISCGQNGEDAPASAPETSVVEAPPVPSDFEPCNTLRFVDVQAVIGVRPTITSDDRSGAISSGWATCSYGRSDGSEGPTLTVRIAKFDSSDAAGTRHQQLVGDIAGASAIPGDADNAYLWSEGNSLHLQYQRGWWVQRRTVDGDTNAQVRQALVAAPRWP